MFIRDSWVNICAWLQSPGKSPMFDETILNSVALLYSVAATAEFDLSLCAIEHGRKGPL